MKKKSINNKRIEKIRMIKNNSKTKLSEYEKQIIKKFKEALIVNEVPISLVPSYMGVSKQQYSKYRRGESKIPIASLYSLGLNAGVSMCEFFPETKKPNGHLKALLKNKSACKILKKLSLIEQEQRDIGLHQALESLLDVILKSNKKLNNNLLTKELSNHEK